MVSIENSSLPVGLHEDNIKLRELFVQNLNGTTVGEVLLFTSQLPFFVFINIFFEICVLNKFFNSSTNKGFNKVVVFLFEFATIVCPTIFLFTVSSDFITHTLLAVLFITFFIIIFSVTSPDTSVLYWKLPHAKGNFLKDYEFPRKQPFVTYFRSLVFITTATSILGVDFHIYPRRFAKTETYGISIMDLGVGLFVMSSALVKKAPEKRNERLYNTLLESLVFVTLGVIRYFAVQRLNYQQHVSEYGVHWNFFFTLAFVKLVSYLIMKISRGYNLICAILILMLHQYLLSYYLEDYVLSNVERDGWFNANREGIVSLCGYLSLYHVGLAISNIVNPVDSNSTVQNNLKTFGKLLTIGVCLFFITLYLNSTVCQVSRRLTNLSYVTWITTLSLILLAVMLMVELLCICFLPVKPHLKGNLYSIITPALLESVNFNGLIFFLMSNLLTGLVNLCIDVLNLDSSQSLIILIAYMTVNCVVVSVFYTTNVKFKLW